MRLVLGALLAEEVAGVPAGREECAGAGGERRRFKACRSGHNVSG